MLSWQKCSKTSYSPFTPTYIELSWLLWMNGNKSNFASLYQLLYFLKYLLLRKFWRKNKFYTIHCMCVFIFPSVGAVYVVSIQECGCWMDSMLSFWADTPGSNLTMPQKPVYTETDTPQATWYPPVTLIQWHLKIIAPEKLCFCEGYFLVFYILCENYSFGSVLRKKLQPFDYPINLWCHDTLTMVCNIITILIVPCNFFCEQRSKTGIVA